jgi:hypothetical protein
LVEALLAEGGIACTLTRLETSEAFAAALEVGGFDLILSDNALPYGLSALARARERCPEVSFIFVYGSGERALDFIAKIAESSTAYLSSARRRPPCTWHTGNRSGGRRAQSVLPHLATRKANTAPGCACWGSTRGYTRANSE